MGARLDAVVVGGGPNGLTAAVLLARAGLAVGVWEAGDTIGGAASTTELTLPGFRHDLGSAVHPFAAGSPAFRDLALTGHGLEWLEPALALAHPFDDDDAAVLDRPGQGAVEHRRVVVVERVRERERGLEPLEAVAGQRQVPERR